jgi:class 3 adenylate cyclase
VRFQQKAFVASILGIAVLSAVTATVAVYLGRVHLMRTIEADFRRAPALLQRQLDRRFDAFKLDVENLSEDKRYASWLGRASAADVPSGHVAPKDLKAAHDGLGAIELTLWDEFLVMNDAGILLFDVRRQDVLGEDRSSDPAIRRALAGEAVMRLRGPFLEMARAVTVEDSVRGVLLAAIPLEPIRDDLETALRSHVSFEVNQAGDGIMRMERRGSQIWLTCSVSIYGVRAGEVIGRFTLERSLTQELTPLLRDLLFAIGVGTAAELLLALVLAFLLARALSAPLSALVQATRRIAKGDFDHRVEIPSQDELGELGRAFNQMAVALKNRVFFESALRHYLAAPVVEQLIRDPSRLQLGGEKREVTVLFFDVAGFTKVAEMLQAEELVALVNGYLDQLVAAIFRHGGTFDKFVGDAVMAFWGAPLPQGDHAEKACRAALDMQRAFGEFSRTYPDPRVRGLRGRVGINSGPAVLGNLGSTQIMSYTAMGDTVNVASRLEGVNKIYGTAILASESTVTQAGWRASREVDLVRVLGRSAPIRIFEIFAEGELGTSPAVILYQEGLEHFRARRFLIAETKFREASALGDSGCAEYMAGRAASLGQRPPAEGWDGSHHLESK